MELQITQLDDQLMKAGSNVGEAVTLSARQNELQIELEGLYSTWEELETFVEEHDGQTQK